MTAPATGMSIARGQWSFLPGLVAEAVLVARPDARDARPPDRPCRAGHEDRRRIAAGRAADIHCEERAGRTGRRTLDLDDRAADLPLRLVGYRKDHFAAALLRGLAYALLAENVHPLIPLVTAETFAVWVVAAVALAELLKNVFYEPIVPGGAVKLHRLVVAIGVVGGAILFGPAGMLLAIPTLVIVRVLAASSARHLKAYGVV